MRQQATGKCLRARYILRVKMSSSDPPGEGQNGDGGGAGAAQGAGAVVGGRARGQDVVHEQDAAVLQAVRIPDGEGAPHVPGAARSVEFGLGPGFPDPLQALERQGETEAPGDPVG